MEGSLVEGAPTVPGGPWRYMPMYALAPHLAGDTSALADFSAAMAADKQTLAPPNMPSDPRMWSHQQVCIWLDWCTQHFSLPRIDLDNFHMNGRALCLLTKSDMKDRVPRAGDVLFNSLHILILRTAPTPNVSNLLLGQAAAANVDRGCPNLQRLWSRSVSSDFHNIGYMVPESSSGQAEMDSTVILSPAPSTEGNSDKSSAEGKGNSDLLHHTGSGSEEEEEPLNGHKENNCYAPAVTLVHQSLQPQLQAIPMQAHTPAAQQDYPQEKSVRLLWDFLQQLLNDPCQRYKRCIAWKDKGTGVFKIVDPHQLAYLWGMQKNHLNMNFDKMSRALRYYYRVKILQKEPGERHCYRFLRHPTELRNCKQRSLLANKNVISTANENEGVLSIGDENDGVLNMSVKDEWPPEMESE